MDDDGSRREGVAVCGVGGLNEEGDMNEAGVGVAMRELRVVVEG